MWMEATSPFETRSPAVNPLFSAGFSKKPFAKRPPQEAWAGVLHQAELFESSCLQPLEPCSGRGDRNHHGQDTNPHRGRGEYHGLDLTAG
jgi:hypothetical protein